MSVQLDREFAQAVDVAGGAAVTMTLPVPSCCYIHRIHVESFSQAAGKKWIMDIFDADPDVAAARVANTIYNTIFSKAESDAPFKFEDSVGFPYVSETSSDFNPDTIKANPGQINKIWVRVTNKDVDARGYVASIIFSRKT